MSPRESSRPTATDTIQIRPGDPADAERLTDLVAASKAFWGYSEQQMTLFQDELRIDAGRLMRSPAFVAWAGDVAVGICTLEENEAIRLSMEHLFVTPRSMGRGVGRALVCAAIEWARASGYTTIEIWSDPHAVGFYRTMGARRTGEAPSLIPGGELPIMMLDVGLKTNQ